MSMVLIIGRLICLIVAIMTGITLATLASHKDDLQTLHLFIFASSVAGFCFCQGWLS